MKFLMIFAAVLLVSKAAKVPQLSDNDVIHKVTVPVPMNVFAATPEVLPAVVVEVSKDHVHEPDMPVMVEQPIKEEMVTIQPPELDTTTQVDEEEGTTVADSLETDKLMRKARAVPFVDYQYSAKQSKLSNDVNVVKSILSQRKTNWNNKPHRSVRSIDVETASDSLKPISTDMPVMEMSTMKTMEMSTMSSMDMSTTKVLEMSTMKALEISTINPCDLLCTKFEFIPVCATNGLCLHEFPNQCILDTYNCKHPLNKFSATKADKCLMNWLTKCEESDLI